MPNSLKLFYDNTMEREEVRNFFVEQLREMAADRAPEGESVSGVKDAHDCLTRAFDRLDELYGKIERITEQNSR